MKLREQISAWILMSVFLPAILLSGLHIHSLQAAPIDCDDCVEHVHHASHITQYSSPVDDCVVCRFMSQRFVAEFQPQEIKADAVIVAVIVKPVAEAVVDAYYGVTSLRAPPAIL